MRIRNAELLAGENNFRQAQKQGKPGLSPGFCALNAYFGEFERPLRRKMSADYGLKLSACFG
jgi:hypothetical protein